MNFSRNTWRVALGSIVAFYAVIGGLFLSHYVPYRRVNNMDYAAFDPRDDAARYDVLNFDYHSSGVDLYGSILIWATVALLAFAAALWFTRRSSNQ